MAERYEEVGKPFYELAEAIEGVFSPYEIEAHFKEAFRLILASEVDVGEQLFSIYWSLTERNVLAKVLEEAIERTTGRRETFSDTMESIKIDILPGDVNDPEADHPRDFEKVILQTILRSEDGDYISWEDIEGYELILSARARRTDSSATQEECLE